MPESSLREPAAWQPVPLLGSGAPSHTAERSRCGRWQISSQQSPNAAGQATDYYHLWRRDPASGAVQWVHTYYSAEHARDRAAEEVAA
jgi:hypothetical protein